MAHENAAFLAPGNNPNGRIASGWRVKRPVRLRTVSVSFLKSTFKCKKAERRGRWRKRRRRTAPALRRRDKAPACESPREFPTGEREHVNGDDRMVESWSGNSLASRKNALRASCSSKFSKEVVVERERHLDSVARSRPPNTPPR